MKYYFIKLRACLNFISEFFVVIFKWIFFWNLKIYRDILKIVGEKYAKKDIMVQPFVEEIRNGEWSLAFFDGKYSHAVLKVPQENDFRVQHF